ncbi:MAG: EamA family transporter [Actinomycetes bacterium]|nr:EamA family transporter [Actinomycetes bacterium]
MTKRTRVIGIVAILFAGVIWGTIPVIKQHIHASPQIVVFGRVLCGLLAMSVWLGARGKLPRVVRLSRTDTIQLLIQGGILGINWLLFLAAFDHASVATAELLAYFGPPLVAVMAPFMIGERFDRQIILPLLLSVAGLVIVVAPHGLGGGGGTELWGALLAFASSITYAILMVRGKKFSHTIDRDLIVWYECLGATVIMIPIAIWSYAHGGAAATGVTDWGWMLVLGAVHTAAASLLMYVGLERLRADQSSVFTYAEPVSGIIFAWLLMGQHLTWTGAAGGALIVIGGTLVARNDASHGIELGSLEAPYRGHDLGAMCGWQTAPDDADSLLRELVCIRDAVRRDFTLCRILVLGMGGSALGARLLAQLYADELEGLSVTVQVLDTVEPATVAATRDCFTAADTLVVVASKSGTTIEVDALWRLFHARAVKQLGADAAGSHFIALTDGGTELEQVAREGGWRAVVTTPANVGGRYSVLTAFGLAPVVLAGVDVGGLPAGARAVTSGGADAALLGDTIVLPVGADPLQRAYAQWLEQLIAESLGKEGRGPLPVLCDDASAALMAELPRTTVLRPAHMSPTAMGAALMRWMYAVEAAAEQLDVDPFDQPDVASAKAATRRVLSEHETDGYEGAPQVLGYGDANGVCVGDGAPRVLGGTLIASATENHVDDSTRYIALLIWAAEDQRTRRWAEQTAAALIEAHGVPVTVQFGPRYLHSTGQLHKGGPAGGLFVFVRDDGTEDLPIPGRPYSLRQLFCAQMTADIETLQARGRRVLS